MAAKLRYFAAESSHSLGELLLAAASMLHLRTYSKFLVSRSFPFTKLVILGSILLQQINS
jgi:hypothetical protein